MNDPIRVLHVIGSMNRGGAEAMIMNLYRNIDRTRVQFDFVENTPDRAAFDDEIEALGGRIFRCPHYNGKNHFAYVRWWRDFFSAHPGQFAAVHGHLGSTAAIYLAIAKKHGIYTIAHSHNVRTQLTPGEILYAIYAYPVRFLADQLFTCSRAAGISRYGKKHGANPARCICLNNAIDTGAFSLDLRERRTLREELGLQHKLVIGHIGRFNPQKNHRFLLEVFRQIAALSDNAVLVLVGDGSLRAQIEQQIRDYGLEGRVMLTGVRTDVSRFYSAMDVLLFPSLYEGLPVTLVEAQCSGLPCVISDNVPIACAITDDLVTVKRLEETPQAWASHVLERAGIPRTDHSAVIRKAGFDITQTAKWLGDYYLDIRK